MCSTRHYLKALALWHFHLQGDFCRHQNTVWLRFSFYPKYQLPRLNFNKRFGFLCHPFEGCIGLLLPIGFVRLHSNSFYKDYTYYLRCYWYHIKCAVRCGDFNMRFTFFEPFYRKFCPLNAPLHEVYRCPGLSRMRMGRD